MTDAEKIRKLGEGLVLLLELRTELRRSTPAEQQTIQQCLAIIRHQRTAPEPPETARMSVIGQTQPTDRDEGVGKPQKDQKTGAGPTCPDNITPCSVQIGDGEAFPVRSWEVRAEIKPGVRIPVEGLSPHFEALHSGKFPGTVCPGCGGLLLALMGEVADCKNCGSFRFEREHQNAPPELGPCWNCGCPVSTNSEYCKACGESQ